jgi:hypothetical protein
LSIGLKGNTDGSGAVQIGGSDAITISTGLNTTFAGTVTATGTVAGATGTLYPLVAGTAVASTSGTAIDFTGIPSWVRRITVMFNGVSISGTSDIIIRLGVSGTPETTGYLTNYFRSAATSIATSTSTTDSFVVTGGIAVAANLIHGPYTFSLLTPNVWVGSGVLYSSGTTNYMVNSSGSKSLAGVLNMVRITTLNGTDTFDAGSINILYE